MTDVQKPLTITGLAAEIETRIGVKPNITKHIIKTIGEIAESEISSGRQFSFPGVATVRLAYQPRKPKREVRNPQTGETRMADPAPAKIAIRARAHPKMKRAAPTPQTKAGKAIADAYKAKRG
jgi:nucleoid DNA-binding protein